MLLKHTVFNVLERCDANGYSHTTGLQLLLNESNKRDGKWEGEGEHLIGEMELDRVNVFKSFFNDIHAMEHFVYASDLVWRGDVASAIDYLRKFLDQEE